MAPPDTLPPAPDDTKEPAAGQRWLLLAPLALVLLPIGFNGIGQEIALWYQAMALEAELSGHDPQAIHLIEKGLAWDPSSIPLLIELASRRLSDGVAQDALPMADQAVRLARLDWDAQRSEYNQLVLSQALNLAAYVRALSNEDLGHAKSQIDEAIRLAGGNIAIDLANLLDTRGYVSYLLGDLPSALDDMEEAIKMMESSVEQRLAQVRIRREMEIDARPSRAFERQLREARAVLYHHRGLVYRALGRSGEADADLRRAKELGYNPQAGVW